MTALSIGVDARPLSHPFTGIGRYTDAILRQICDAGHHYYLYATEPLESQYSNTTVRTTTDKHARLRSTFDAQLRFPGWAKNDKLDVFWSPRHHLPLCLSIPTVVTVHDLVWRVVPQTMAPFARFNERALMRPSVGKASAIIAVSESTRRDLEAWQPQISDKISVITEAPCVTPPAQPDHVADLPQRFFLFVGTFEPRKNLTRLLRAFASIANQVPHDLVLAGGRGWDSHFHRELAAMDETLRVRVHCIHPEHNVPIAELYARCEVFVFPSLYEGFGLPLTEAMAFGKPLLTANNSSLPEVAGNAAIYIDALNVEDIAQGLKKLANEPALREELARNAAIRTSLFSWKSAALQTLSVLEHAAREVT